jgi:hypothetical protein
MTDPKPRSWVTLLLCSLCLTALSLNLNGDEMHTTDPLFHSADPNAKDLPNWPPYASGKKTIQLLDTDIGQSKNTSLPLCDALRL